MEGLSALVIMVVVVDNNRRAIIVSRSSFGAANDKIIVKACEEMRAIMEGSMEDVLIHIYDGSGNLMKVKGAYLIDWSLFAKMSNVSNASSRTDFGFSLVQLKFVTTRSSRQLFNAAS